MYPLYLRNVSVNINHINKLKLFTNKSPDKKKAEKNESVDGKLDYYSGLKIPEAKLFLTDDDFSFYKNILKGFIKNYPQFNKDNYKEYITEFIEKILNYNTNNMDYILNCNMDLNIV